jgi:hypothetical protein
MWRLFAAKGRAFTRVPEVGATEISVLHNSVISSSSEDDSFLDRAQAAFQILANGVTRS